MADNDRNLTETLKAIIIDWAFIFIIIFLVSLLVYTINLIFIEWNVIGMLGSALAFVDSHFYTTLLLTVVMLTVSLSTFIDLRRRKQLTYRYDPDAKEFNKYSARPSLTNSKNRFHTHPINNTYLSETSKAKI